MDERLKADAERLRKQEASYLRAKSFIESPEGAQANSEALERIRAIVQAARATPDYVVGAVSEVLFGLDKPHNVIRDYESLRKSVQARHAQSAP